MSKVLSRQLQTVFFDSEMHITLYSLPITDKLKIFSSQETPTRIFFLGESGHLKLFVWILFNGIGCQKVDDIELVVIESYRVQCNSKVILFIVWMRYVKWFLRYRLPQNLMFYSSLGHPI